MQEHTRHALLDDGLHPHVEAKFLEPDTWLEHHHQDAPNLAPKNRRPNNVNTAQICTLPHRTPKLLFPRRTYAPRKSLSPNKAYTRQDNRSFGSNRGRRNPTGTKRARRSGHSAMTEAEPTATHFTQVVSIVMCWNQPKHPVQELMPDTDRIQLVVRPGYNMHFHLATTCKDAYQKEFWVKTNCLRWTEIRDALRNLVSRVVAGQLPVFVSQGRFYYLCEEKRTSRIHRLRTSRTQRLLNAPY